MTAPKPSSIAAKHPELLRRLVNPEVDGLVSAGGHEKVTVWCNGAVQAKELHERREYQQVAHLFVSGTNSCGWCGLRGEANQIRHARPDLLARLVNPEVDGLATAGGKKKVTVWCDGIAAGREPHSRREYTQTAQYLASGQNACGWCGPRGEANQIRHARPDLLARLVNPEVDGLVVVGAAKKVAVWCDGVVNRKDSHERREYLQAAHALSDGQNACGWCGHLGEASQIRHARPDLLPRLVNPEADGLAKVGDQKKVTLWCDGTVAGKEAHDRQEYTQAAQYLASGQNACGWCGRRGEASQIRHVRPDLLPRLVKPEVDGLVAAGAAKKVTVWCDGTVVGGKAHERREYTQTAQALSDGRNACGWCGPFGKANQIRHARPDLLPRLVNPEVDGLVTTGNPKKVVVWCDGAVAGEKPHVRAEYEQVASKLTSGQNACGWCGPFGKANQIRHARPDLLPRLVNPEVDGLVTTGNPKKVVVWCDGAVAGEKPHVRAEYEQNASLFAIGQNACTWCGRGGEGSQIRHARPDLIARLVNPEVDGLVTTGNDGKIKVWCDGTASGEKPHVRVEYDQIAAKFASGQNACTWCSRGGECSQIRHARPDLIARLVNPEVDGLVTVGHFKEVEVWCDGTVVGKLMHERREYKQDALNFAAERNGCPICATSLSKSREKLLLILSDLVDHVGSLSPMEMLSLVRRHRLNVKHPAVQALLGGDVPTLREMLDDLAGDDADLDDFDDLAPELGEVDAAGAEVEVDVETHGRSGRSAHTPSLPELDPGDLLDAMSTAANLALGSDEDAVRFLVTSFVHRLWQHFYASTDKESFLAAVRERLAAEPVNGFFAAALGDFLGQHAAAEELEIPARWSYPHRPNLMQRHVATLVQQRRTVGNWSGTGAGKTASAILAAMVAGAEYVLVVCPNNTVNGWVSSIRSADPTAAVQSKTLRPDFAGAAGQKWLVVNYDVLPGHASALEALLSTVPFGMLVIDEVHFVKQRSADNLSERSQVLRSIRKRLPEDAYVLGMSATPVVNNLAEGRSLVELVDGHELDIDDRLTLDNVVALHENLVRIGFRAIINPEAGLTEETPQVDISHLHDDLLTPGLTHPQVDALVASAYIPTVVAEALAARARGKGVLVYTEFVEGIIEPLTDALRAAGLRVAEFSGREKADVAALRGTTDVLIGTRAIGTGVDGVQHWADTVIYVSLPWTAAEYEQSRARVYRQGSTADEVRVVIPMGVIAFEDGREWSWTASRLARIGAKRDIAAAAVDGIIPTEHLTTPAQATRAAMDMLERLSEDASVPQERRELVDPGLGTDATHTAHVSDLGTVHARWNSSLSATVHERLAEDPAAWHAYHELYTKARKDWPTVPAQEIADDLALSRLAKSIADLGCGQMLLADALAAAGSRHQVTGFDHVAHDERVTVADISNLTMVADGEFDVVVLSLALMGKNAEEYLDEARRIVHNTDGVLYLTDTDGHLGRDEARLRTALRSVGFAVVTCDTGGKFVHVKAHACPPVGERVPVVGS